MKLHSYVGGILVKLLSIIMIMIGVLLFLYSDYISQETGVPIGAYWIVSWILFIMGLIVFAGGVVVQRRALKRLRTPTPHPSA
ncbi:MAG: hypothetical protein WED05_09125 [Candidatus Atabeyarchaeum deiterrae]